MRVGGNAGWGNDLEGERRDDDEGFGIRGELRVMRCVL
jgi:hypothetical protein